MKHRNKICRNRHLNQQIIACFVGGIANTDDESEYMYRTMNCLRSVDVFVVQPVCYE